MSSHKSNRNLAMVRESGSTTRVLNLALTSERFGTTQEYQEKPLFNNRRLNTSLILKHTIRASEREYIHRHGTTATKIVLPFAASDLRLGGASFFVGQADFERKLREIVGAGGDEAGFARDVEVLRIIDELPSFDPFLLRERLRRSGFDPARCYFDLSEADSGRMRTFVEKEIGRLVELAFSKSSQTNAAQLSARMAEKLMTDENASSLEPLRQTLQMSGEDYREGVFAWKGFLYYSWLVGDIAPRLAELARAIASVGVRNASYDEKEQLATMRKRVIDLLGMASGRVRAGLRAYQQAYDKLAAGEPAAFRGFLLQAPQLFLSVGEAISIITHIESFWRFRFPSDARTPVLEAPEALEIFGEFETTLGGVE